MNLFPSFLLGAAVMACSASSLAATAPAPYGAIPTEQQVAWQRMEYYAFVHFGLNTWTNREWGYGDEDPKLFNPSDFNADRIVKLFKKAGMTGVILTAKHHDGFCLWPTKTTEHNISQSPWKNGKGNLVADFAKACKDNNMKFGTYLSPWDRNHKDYAKPGYIKDYYAQISELLSNFGPVFEIWFDGANGGDGYYGGAKEKRTMPDNYYNFPLLVKNIRKLQPNCIIWGADHYGDARWGGSEQGHVGYPHWHTENETGRNSAHGNQHGTKWVAAEGDTSIRSGWFWHKSANGSVKSPEKLLKVWMECVGRGANLILNVPPDQTGNIYSADAESLLAFKDLRDQLYARDMAKGAKTQASNVRGKDRKFGPENMIDGNIESYWTTDDGQNTPSCEFTFPTPRTFDVVRVREQIRLGQRVESFKVEAWVDGAWKNIIDGKTIGNQVMLQTAEKITTDKVRLTITGCPAVPCISEFSLLMMPVAMPKPQVTLSGDTVTIDANVEGTIHYTTDGSRPTDKSPIYKTPVKVTPGTFNACIIDKDGNIGPVATQRIGLNKKAWKIAACSDKTSQPKLAIDDDPTTTWLTTAKAPQTITVDMGATYKLDAFSYLPRQDGKTEGMTTKYTFEVSPNGKKWAKVAQGEFSNLRANPIEQTIDLKKIKVPVRFFRFTGTDALDTPTISAAEISVYGTPAK